MTLNEFEEIVEAAALRIPKRFKVILKKEGIQLLARAKAPAPARGRKDTLTFGMFIGIPYTKRSVFGALSEPTRIELYKDSFEAAYSDPAEMARQIALTVAHEIGHYFGFSEAQLRKHKV